MRTMARVPFGRAISFRRDCLEFGDNDPKTASGYRARVEEPEGPAHRPGPRAGEIDKGKVEAYRTKLKVSFKYEGKD